MHILLSERADNTLTERCLNVRPYDPVTPIARSVFLPKTCNPRFGKTNCYIDLPSSQGRDHMARAGRERLQRSRETEVLLRKVNRGGEVLGHEADAERLRACHCIYLIPYP